MGIIGLFMDILLVLTGLSIFSTLWEIGSGDPLNAFSNAILSGLMLLVCYVMQRI